jgi:hypothetical protein
LYHPWLLVASLSYTLWFMFVMCCGVTDTVNVLLTVSGCLFCEGAHGALVSVVST